MYHYQINAAPWVELVGIVRFGSKDRSYAYVEIENRLLRVNQGKPEMDTILGAICDMKIGKKVGILFTDLPDKPVVVRAIVCNPAELCTLQNSTCQKTKRGTKN